jgi:hypothetical protein
MQGFTETNGLNGMKNFEERGPQEGRPSIDSVPYFDDGRPIWAQPRFARFLRVRLLSDPGYPNWDLSYAFAEMIDGSIVRLFADDVPGGRYGFRKRSWKKDAVEEAKRWKVFLKRTEFFDAISTLI